MKNTGKGWVTAEYSMLPGASPERIDREAAKGKQSGRTVEIQRLIGRSLRAACDMKLLGERQVVVDCDVLQADGGTRTASICGGYLALHDALSRLVQSKAIKAIRCTRSARRSASASSVACRCSTSRTSRTRRAEVDMNVVMLGKDGGEPLFVEVQGTAEGAAFSRGELDVAVGAGIGGLSRDHGAAGRDGVGAAVATPARSMTVAVCDWSARRPTPTRWPRSPRSSTVSWMAAISLVGIGRCTGEPPWRGRGCGGCRTS